MKTLFILISLLLNVVVAKSQITFQVKDNPSGFSSSSDFKLKISENLFMFDLSIKIGQDILLPDFTVGITSDKSQADFIITDSYYTDYSISIHENSMIHEDFSIKAGKDLYLEDLAIQIKEYGKVNYLVYSEKGSITLNELIAALLPAIHYHTDFEHDALKELFKDLK